VETAASFFNVVPGQQLLRHQKKLFGKKFFLIGTEKIVYKNDDQTKK